MFLPQNWGISETYLTEAPVPPGEDPWQQNWVSGSKHWSWVWSGRSWQTCWALFNEVKPQILVAVPKPLGSVSQTYYKVTKFKSLNTVSTCVFGL